MAFALTMAGILGTISFGITIYGIWQRLQMRRRRKRFFREMACVTPDHRCTSCDGYATELVPDPETKALVCKDRNLCEAIRIYRTMLES